MGRSRLAQSGLDAAQRWGTVISVAVTIGAIVAVSVLLAMLRSLLTYGNLVLTRTGQNLHLTHGLLRVREQTFDTRRLRGGTLREPLPVRALGGARLDAVMTGVGSAGEASLLLPPCPADTARAVLTGLVGDDGVVSGPLLTHGPAAARRRWVRALLPPAVAGVVLVAVAVTLGAPGWLWPGWALFAAGSVFLAVDRARALGHRVRDGWLVTRQGSLQRRRDCIETAGVIGWTVRQTYFQRRAGVATVIAATAAGAKRYTVVDVPAELAWVVAAQASPWVADSVWAQAL